MNRQSKSAIKSLVLELRHTLEDDLFNQLKRYGYAAGRWIEPEKLPHLWTDDTAMSERQRIDTALGQQLRRIGAEPPAQTTAAQREEAVGWFVREVAYTHLNRLAALKALEVRGLVPEVITTRQSYGGRSRLHYDLRNALPELCRGPDEGLAEAVRHACGLVYREFRLLFDVGDPAEGRAAPVNTLIWPGHTALKACIAAINSLDERAGNTGLSLWLEDEIIGWLYQFYTAEEKEAIRKRGRPNRPAEVAIINQFFTPRWIVKFLVDNTLGRLWLEMHPDSARVRAKCDYLVPEALPSPYQPGVSGARQQVTLDPDSPVNNPAARPRRKAKKPQEIRLIDPTCGTMHFGHYAFEVFQEIYAEARERGWVTGRDALPDTEVPAAILRNNLFGVDIDLRAVQLSGLSLYMKARTAEAALGVEETRINQVNLVVADAVLPQDGAREAFLAQYAADKRVQAAVAQVLDEMADVAQVGSLLRVEERLRQVLSQAGAQAPSTWLGEQQPGLPGLEPPQRQLSLAEIPGVAPEPFGAHYTLSRLLDDLRAFAAYALRQHDLNAQLFAEEASKSVQLLDVFLNEYDAVVMNPPFGTTLEIARGYLNRAYKAFAGNLLCAFVERALSDLSPSGFVGSVLDRTFLLKMTYEDFRRKVLLDGEHLVALLDLGWDILDDANVEVSALVADGRRASRDAVFYRSRIGSSVNETREPLAVMDVFHVPVSDFATLPNAALAYWIPPSVRSALSRLPSIDPAIVTAREGIHPNDADRFIRMHWEVDGHRIGRYKAWVPLANGGGFAPYYRDNESVIWYAENAKDIRLLRGMRNEHLQFRRGITWGKRTDCLSVQHLPEGHAFTHEGHCAFPNEDELIWPVIGILNTNLMRFTIDALCGQHKTSGYIGQLPYSPPEPALRAMIGTWAESAHDLKAAWDTGNELCTRFDAPWLVQAWRGTLPADSEWQTAHEQAVLGPSSGQNAQRKIQSLGGLLDHVRAVEDAADARLQQLQTEIDEAVYDLYEIGPEDRALIEHELGVRPPELVWPQMERKSDAEKRREHARRLVSWCLLGALRVDADGILTLEQAVDGVRRGLEAEFGDDAAFQMEADLKSVLGQDLEGWLDGAFFKWHTALCRRTPIVWHLASADSRRALNLFVDYHKLSADTLRKVQTLYLWPARRRQESLRAIAQVGRDPAGIEAAELALEALADFERRLLTVIEARVACDIPEWAQGPFRGGVYDPVLDDGVRVNLLPLQEAGLLRVRKVV